MMTTIRDECIGSIVHIIDSTNKEWVGLQGIIVDETKFSFIIMIKNVKKRILKKGCVFNIDGQHVVGDQILRRSEDRIKLKS